MLAALRYTVSERIQYLSENALQSQHRSFRLRGPRFNRRGYQTTIWPSENEKLFTPERAITIVTFILCHVPRDLLKMENK